MNMMERTIQKQLYLVLSILVVQLDICLIKKFFKEWNVFDIDEILSLICVMWPEVDDPLNLEFIFKVYDKSNIKNSDLLASLISEKPELVSILSSDQTVIEERYEIIRNFVHAQLRKFNLKIDHKQPMISFLKSRIVMCNDIIIDVTYYAPLWNNVVGNSEEDHIFRKWVSGILEPLNHRNKRFDKPCCIYDFEQMTSEDILRFFWDSMTNDVSILHSVLKFEIIPYLSYSMAYKQFFSNIITIDEFPLDTWNSFKAFKQIFLDIRQAFNEDPELDNLLQKQILDVLYHNCNNLKNLSLSDLSHELLMIFDNIDNELMIQGVTVLELKHFVKYMDILKISDIKDIIHLSHESDLSLFSYFSTITSTLLRENPSLITIHTLTSLIGDGVIFSKISKEKQESIIIETLLCFGEFSLLQDFTAELRLNLDNGIFLKYFWRFFNNASDGSNTNVDIRRAHDILKLLSHPVDPELKLLELANQLSKYHLYYTPNILFKPFHILEFKDNPFELISKLLNLNQYLYMDLEETTNILELLFSGLKIKSSGPELYEEKTRLLALHIDFALVNLDFQFAHEKTLELFKRNGAGNHWSTFFQVGKFVNPNWLDNETPTEIIYLQLEILGKLLHICPEEEAEAVVSLWSGLELELSTRDLLNDKYSLKNISSTKEFKQKIMEDVSSTVSNFLSTGIKWAVGNEV